MQSVLHSRRRASWRQHFIAVARAFEAGMAPVKPGMRPGLKPGSQGLAAGAGAAAGCAPSHS